MSAVNITQSGMSADLSIQVSTLVAQLVKEGHCEVVTINELWYGGDRLHLTLVGTSDCDGHYMDTLAAGNDCLFQCFSLQCDNII